MKRIKQHVNCYCQTCTTQGTEKVRAVWRCNRGLQRMCDEHKSDIKELLDSGEMSEADYQTWGRF